VRGADVAFVSFERLPRGAKPEGFLTVPPELIVEVLGDDSSWREMEKKIAEYHAFGVDNVWVIDARMLALRIYPRGGQPMTLHGDAEAASSYPAGFRCLVREFFE
jgi:Uma2 family endonuclease